MFKFNGDKIKTKSILFLLLICIISGGFFMRMLGPGLSSPQAIGSFLNGNLPTLTPGDGNNIQYSLDFAFTGIRFDSTLVITPHPRENKIFVASQSGLIEYFENDPNVTTKNTLADLRTQTALVWDGGILGLAFHPDFGLAGSPNRNYFYIYHTAKGPNGEYGPYPNCDGNCHSCEYNPNFFGSYIRLSRFSVQDGTLALDPNSEQILFNIRQYNGSHRGGGLTFGQDGFLYLTIGDQSRKTTAQKIHDNFEGGVFCFDVNQTGGNVSHAPRRHMGIDAGHPDEYSGNGYYIPNTNPWQDTLGGVFEEYYSNGHRSPHRMTMDRLTGDLWIGEVGENTHEEVNIVRKGENGGWPIYEGNLYRQFTDCGSDTITMGPGVHNPPVVEFNRTEAIALIGGYVYRGSKFPGIYGKYLCGDYNLDNVYAIEEDANGVYSKEILFNFSAGRLTTFGEGPDGEIYMGRHVPNATLYTIKATGANPPAPQYLSQTGAFSDLINLIPTQGVIPYDMIEPFWSDGAEKSRWLAIPNDGTHDTVDEMIQFSADGNWVFPKGAVLIKHFELAGKRLETRFEVRGSDGNYYYLSYKWNAAGTDAELLTTGLDETIMVNGQPQVWHYPSPAECLSCHTQSVGNVLGAKTRYLNGNMTYPSTGINANQLVTLSHLNIINENITDANSADYMAVAAKDDLSATLEYRARSYLDVNCSYCHQPATSNRGLFDARITTPLSNQDIINGPLISYLGLNDPRVVIPQDTMHSMIYHRMNTLQTGVSMPPLGKNVIDTCGVQLIADWIGNLSPVMASTDIWLEAECGLIGANWTTNTDTTASDDNYVVIPNGWQGSPPTDAAEMISYTFTIPQAGNYKIWGRTLCMANTDDSFWIQVDNDNWILWNDIPNSNTWQWNAIHDSNNSNNTIIYNLSQGTHTLNLSWREDGAQMDKFYIALDSETPTGIGGIDTTCVTTPPLGCTLVGQTCDDNDVCTTNDIYDANCNCVGTIQDTDNDGVCDANDICANGDDTIDLNNNGIPDACDVPVIVADIWLEAECGLVGSNWLTNADPTASEAEYITTPNGWQGSPPTDTADIISYTFTIPQTGNYKIWGRTLCTISSDDSFWIQVDNDNWIRWNGIPHSSIWQWDDVHDSDDAYRTVIFNLSQGTHTLNLGWREDGAQIDKFYIAFDTETPTGIGGIDTTCVTTPPLDCTLVGQTCDDNDVCTTNDIYDANCNCAGTIQDTDNDGICDANDSCPIDVNNLCDTVAYCTSFAISTTSEYIQKVTFSSISNNSGDDGGYGDYTNMTANLVLGNSTNLKLTPGFPNTAHNVYWSVWVDFNQDGDFEDTDETVYTGNGSGSKYGLINVPLTAALDSTRLRISMLWNTSPAACDTLSYGEVEDYTVKIISGTNGGGAAMRITEPIPTMFLYPNPVDDWLNIELTHIPSDGQLEIYNNIGQLVQTEKVAMNNLDVKLKTANLRNGVYIVVFRMNNGESLIKRFIKK